MKFAAATSVSTPFREGMYAALMDCRTLLVEHNMTGGILYQTILHKLHALWPPDYQRYYLRGPDSGEPFVPYQAWQVLVDELHERLQLNQILDLGPDSRVMELRRQLLLEHAELPDRHDDPSQPAIQVRDGKIEAYMAVLHALFYARLEGEALSGYLSEHILAVGACPVWLQ